jgi:L-threonylcarbamoyladenylate synthase
MPLHYSPRTPTQLLNAAEIAALLSATASLAQTIAVLRYQHGNARDFPANTSNIPAPRLRTLPADPTAYAAGLYAALHDLDESGASLIIIEIPPGGPDWDAIHDRLGRAASQRNNAGQ